MRMDDAERICVGATISGIDVYGESFEGEVMALDDDYKLVVIRMPSVDKPKTCNVKFVNMEYVSKVDVIKQAPGPPKKLINFNFDKLAIRTKRNIEEKMKSVKYIGSGVTDIGQNLMISLSRIFPESEWNEKDIIVMGEVIVTPPYNRENCRPLGSETRILEIVQQQIEKFHRENKKLPAPGV